MIIGVTGSIGSGKSTASSRLAALGAHVFDADALSRAITGPGGEALPAIEALFGKGVFLQDGSLDRRALAAIVFADADKRCALNEIIHPLVLEQLRENTVSILENAPRAVVVWDVPLLIEAGWDEFCDAVWLIRAQADRRLERIVARDHCTRQEALARIEAQMSDADKARHADEVIDNDADASCFLARLDALYARATERAV